MKIIVKELRAAEQALGRIINQPMDFKLSYRLLRTVKKILTAFNDLERMRVSLVKKYGLEEANGKIRVPENKREDFDKEVETELAKEMELDIGLIPRELLEVAQVKLSPAELVAIENFIEPEVKR